MNSLSLKHKSFLYSLGIHLLLVLLLLSLYFKKDEKHEVYSLINLNSIEICTPSIAKPVKKKQVVSQKKEQVKKAVLEPTKKVSKAKLKPLETKKTVLVKAEPVQQVAVVEPEKTEPKELLEKPVEQEALQGEKSEPVSVEEASAVVAVSEPKLSSEAQYMQDNIALINALIKKNLHYPRLAKKRGLQGRAMVSFTLNLEGEVLDIQALGKLSSILKKSAVKTVKKASVDFPRPSEVLALRIPIVYKLH